MVRKAVGFWGAFWLGGCVGFSIASGLWAYGFGYKFKAMAERARAIELQYRALSAQSCRQAERD